jgi:hypothetical protein
LLNLFRNYYKKLDIRPDYQHAAESTKFDFGIIAGISSSSVNYQSDVSSYYFLTKSDHSPSVNFCAGISLDARMPRRLSRLSIHNELLINSMEFDGRYEQFSSLSYDTINFKLGYIYLRLINMLRYSFTFRNDWSVFVNAGISNAFVLMNKNEKIQSNIFHNATESKAIESDINMEIFNLVGGAGVRYKNVSLDITYERTIGMPSITDLGINTNRLYVMMGYHF